MHSDVIVRLRDIVAHYGHADVHAGKAKDKFASAGFIDGQGSEGGWLGFSYIVLVTLMISGRWHRVPRKQNSRHELCHFPISLNMAENYNMMAFCPHICCHLYCNRNECSVPEPRRSIAENIPEQSPSGLNTECGVHISISASAPYIISVFLTRVKFRRILSIESDRRWALYGLI